MASLTDLFNPSFFIILGIVALLIALVVVYFESKLREQNHKMVSMLSLVSTLAEDMNGVKMGLNHLAITGVNGGSRLSQNEQIPPKNVGVNSIEEKQNNLIEVSDDESENEYDDEMEEDSELEEMDEDVTVESELEEMNVDNGNASDSDEDDEENVKVIKLNISDNIEEDCDNSYEEANNLEFDPEDDLDVLDEMDEIPEISKEYTEEMLSLKYDEPTEAPLLEESQIPSASDLKTISVNLGDETQSEQIDFKKLQLPKLRSITVEKGLITSSEAQKLKKPELLKLLGVE